MLEIINNTPFRTKLAPGLDKQGMLFAGVIIKGTFNIRSITPVLVLANEQLEPLGEDIFFGDAGKSSMQYEADTAWMKPAVDVVLNGHAYASVGKLAAALDTELQIGNFQHRVKVYGKRYWRKDGLRWKLTPPEKFDRLPLLYENSYGGSVPAENDNQAVSHEVNPIGKGFLGSNGRYLEEGMEMPNLEDPENLIQYKDDTPLPTGFGFIGRNWQPRLTYAGTYDKQWEQERLPLLPNDFDDRFYNGAHPNLTLPKGSVEGQRIIARNLSESGSLVFDLPDYRFKLVATIKGRSAEFQPILDTVLIEPDQLRVTLTWRATIPCGQRFLYLDRVAVNWRAA